VEYPKERRVHHEEAVQRTVQSNGSPGSGQRGAYSLRIGSKVSSPSKPDQRLEEEASGTVSIDL
jgi:hypothetical protein